MFSKPIYSSLYEPDLAKDILKGGDINLSNHPIDINVTAN